MAPVYLVLLSLKLGQILHQLTSHQPKNQNSSMGRSLECQSTKVKMNHSKSPSCLINTKQIVSNPYWYLN